MGSPLIQDDIYRVATNHLLNLMQRSCSSPGRARTASRRLPALEAVGEMERLYEIAAIYQEHPMYRAPARIVDEVKPVLASTAPRLLS